MKAIHFDGSQMKLASDYPRPQPRDGEVLVRTRLAGICSTDLQILKGYMSFQGVLGHEFVGEVLEGPDPLVGQRVVGEINFACGRCPLCLRGLNRHCPTRRVMGILNADGAMAETVAVPIANLHEVPDELMDEEAVFTEPLAAALEILEQVHLEPSAEVVVLGDGKLGLLCAQALHMHGARVTLVGKYEEKMELVQELGIHTVPRIEFRPFQADMVVEATGSAQGLAMALEAVRPRGTLVLKSTVAALHEVSLAPLVINEISLVGSRCGPFAPALRALTQGRIRVKRMISEVFPLEKGGAAFELAADPHSLKVLLRA